jgi:hypothetical protein
MVYQSSSDHSKETPLYDLAPSYLQPCHWAEKGAGSFLRGPYIEMLFVPFLLDRQVLISRLLIFHHHLTSTTRSRPTYLMMGTGHSQLVLFKDHPGKLKRKPRMVSPLHMKSQKQSRNCYDCLQVLFESTVDMELNVALVPHGRTSFCNLLCVNQRNLHASFT